MKLKTMEAGVSSKVSWGRVTVLKISRLSGKELDAVWYSRNELRNIRESVQETVDVMMKETAIDENDENHCVRGLEGTTFRGAAAHAACKHDTRTVVLQEQQNQKRKGCYDEEALANASREVSSRCVKEAADTGIQEHQAVQQRGCKDFLSNQKSSFLKSLRLKITRPVRFKRSSVANFLRGRSSSPPAA